MTKRTMETEKLSADLSKSLEGEEGTNVTFIVEGEQVKAHRKILASRCEYFRTLLFGDFVESTQKEIPLDVKAEPFKCIIQYLYTGRSELTDRDVENLLDILDLAHQYGIGELVSGVGKILQRLISTETIHTILNTAVLYDMNDLLAESLKIADLNGSIVLNHVGFTTLSDTAVKVLLKRKSFSVPGLYTYSAVMAWCDKRPTRNNADIKGLIRWSSISPDELVAGPLVVAALRLMS